MADENLDQRLARIETALSTLATKADINAVRADIVVLQTKTEAIETELTKNDERHAELLAAIRDVRDQMFVQGGILVRLEHRDHDADATTLALQHQIQRLERRVERLEQRSEG